MLLKLVKFDMKRVCTRVGAGAGAGVNMGGGPFPVRSQMALVGSVALLPCASGSIIWFRKNTFIGSS